MGLIRLFKPLEHFEEKYGSALWGYHKMYLLMEKQRNRGQDGAGYVAVKFDPVPGRPFMTRIRNSKESPWTRLFKEMDNELDLAKKRIPFDKDADNNAAWYKANFPYAGEVMMAHLRYGTHGSYGTNFCHPVTRTSNYLTRALAMAGNFNLTNVDELFQKLVEWGQFPRFETDTETVLDRVAYVLDKENARIEQELAGQDLSQLEISREVSARLDMQRLLSEAAKAWDGGYVMGGVIGNGDVFVARDPHGIRPCYYYHNDEFLVVASERAAISVVFNVLPGDIQELPHGHLLSVKHNDNSIHDAPFCEPQARKSCSFERIYFSRGSDIKIYNERKDMGRLLVPQVLDGIGQDIENTVFSYIPNTAESAFWGMLHGVEDHLNQLKVEQIMALGSNPDREAVERIMRVRPRMEKSINKDSKLRTFIADDSGRSDLVAHLYDVTQGILRPGVDSLVCIDDSIVRGTTLKRSTLNMLARLNPRKIIIASSAPQIRYPDCYGIDMSNIGQLVAFQAAIALLKERGMEQLIHDTYRRTSLLADAGRLDAENCVKAIYEPFSNEEISAKIGELVKPEGFEPELDIIFQRLENLHRATPNHRGDWYFSGDYPTIGGNRVVNQAFRNYYEGKNQRAYQQAKA